MKPLVVLFSLASVLLPGAAWSVETSAPRAAIVETDTDSHLFGKAIERPFAPANFTKLVTAAVVADALKAGEITLSTEIKVSEHAWRTGGAPARVTTMFAAVRSSVPIEALLKGLVVQYANDAAIVLAEGLSGSEEAFATRMNDFARRIGMQRSRFVNPTGLEAGGARTTVADVARLVDYIKSEHPDLFALYRLGEFEWNKITQLNKTGYVREIPGVTGMVLAYDEADGFGAVVTVEREGRRILVVASGMGSPAERDREVRSLVEAAYSQFSAVTLFPAGHLVSAVRVFGGTATEVPVTGNGPVIVTLPNGDREDFRARVVYDGPVRAPVKEGTPIAALRVEVDGRLYQQVPLLAATDVPAGTMTDRARDGLRELILGWW